MKQPNGATPAATAFNNKQANRGLVVQHLDIAVETAQYLNKQSTMSGGKRGKSHEAKSVKFPSLDEENEMLGAAMDSIQKQNKTGTQT